MRIVLFRISARTSIMPKRPFHVFWQNRSFPPVAFLVLSNRSRPQIHNVFFSSFGKDLDYVEKDVWKKEWKIHEFSPRGICVTWFRKWHDFDSDAFSKWQKLKKSSIRLSWPFAGCGREGCISWHLVWCLYPRNYCANFIISRDQPHLHLETCYRNDIW